MEKTGLRAFLAVILSMAILFGSQYLYTKYYKPSEVQQQPVEVKKEDKKQISQSVQPEPLKKKNQNRFLRI